MRARYRCICGWEVECEWEDTKPNTAPALAKYQLDAHQIDCAKWQDQLVDLEYAKQAAQMARSHLSPEPVGTTEDTLPAIPVTELSPYGRPNGQATDA